MTTRRWYYLIPATGEPRGLVHAIERHNLDHLPGEKTVYAGRQQLDAGLTRLLQGMKRVAMEYSPDVRHPLSLSRRCRHGRGGAGARRRNRVVRRSRPTIRGRLDARAARHAPGRVGGALSHQGSRLRAARGGCARRACARPSTHCSSRWWRGSRKKGWSATPRRSSPSEPTPATRTTCPRRPSVAADSAGRGAAARSVGQDSTTPGAVFADITWVGVHRHDACRRRRRARSTPSPTRATRPCGSSCDGRPGRARSAGMGSRSGGPSGARARPGYGASHPASHRPQPRRERPWQRRAPGRLTRRTTIGGSCPAPALPSSRALYFEDLRRPHRNQRVSAASARRS